MTMIDTHSHLFLEEFADDLPEVMERSTPGWCQSYLYA